MKLFGFGGYAIPRKYEKFSKCALSSYDKNIRKGKNALRSSLLLIYWGSIKTKFSICIGEKMNNIIVGFEFNDDESYSQAKKELEYITKLKENVNTDKADNLLEVYNKIIKEGFFKTPVGMEYLRSLQKELYANDNIDNKRIRSIPAIIYRGNNDLKEVKPEKGNKPEKVNESEKNKVKSKSQNVNDDKKIKEKPGASAKTNSKYKDLYIKMLIVNFVLIITIGVMIIISKKADKFDEDYYRESVENEYINWQNELTERESSISAKESGN